MRCKEDVIFREIAGENILVPVGEECEGNSGLYVLSDVGKRVWELLSNVEDADKIVDLLMEEYDTDRETLSVDVQEYLSRLKALNLVIE